MLLDMWQTIEKFRRKNIMDCFGKLIEDGKKRGVIRKDCNTQVLLLVYLNAIQGIVNPEVLSQLPITASEGLDTILKVFLRVFLQKMEGLDILVQQVKNRDWGMHF